MEQVQLDREQAIYQLENFLSKKNLYELAQEFQVTIQKNGKKNKGWVGVTLEKALHLSASSSAKKDGLDFELKSSALRWNGSHWIPKETVKITQLNPVQVCSVEFTESLLWEKLERLLFVGVHHSTPFRCEVIRIQAIDLEDPKIQDQLSAFWNDLRYLFFSGEFLEFSNLGTSSDLIQLRPTSDGKQKTISPVTGEYFPARAFYATKKLLQQILNPSTGI